MYANGYGVEVDRTKAKAYGDLAHEQWLAACLGSEPRACPHVASSRREGEPTVHELYQRACDHGVEYACIHALHERLTHATGSLDATKHELDQWCSRGVSAACKELALAYDLPDGPREPGRAAALTRRACALGDPYACVRSGVAHELERGVPKDDAVARRYFRRACERGLSHGCFYLAEDILVADGSLREAARLAQRGCEMGSAEACNLLAKIYIASHDDVAVVRWATEACRMGSSSGCQHLIVRNIELPRSIADPVQLYHSACNEKIASACLRLPTLVQAEDDLLRGVVAAIAKQDAAAFATLVANEVDMRGLWFNDPGCAKTFSGTVALTTAQHPALLRCLAKVAVRVEPAPDHLSTPSLAYEPDMKLAVEVRDGVVQQIRGLSFSEAPPPLASSASPAGVEPRNVAPRAIDAYRIAGEKMIVPDPDTKRMIAAAGSPRLVGTFKLCITEHGTIASVTMLKSTEVVAYDRRIERTLYGWRYRPFLLDGKPAPVCTAVTFIYTQI